jgi:hypothetical protein
MDNMVSRFLLELAGKEYSERQKNKFVLCIRNVLFSLRISEYSTVTKNIILARYIKYKW